MTELDDTGESSMGVEGARDNCTRVRYEKCGRVAYVTLDRPRVLNAMDAQMHTELKEAWDEVEQDDEVWVAVLTGAGDRAFSVGQDLSELVQRNRAGMRMTTIGARGEPGWPRLTERFNVAKPIIARVNGYAFGGGFELALACDIIVAAEQACFSLPEAKLGLIPGAGGLFRLTRQIPFRIAMGYLITGRHMSAKQAHELGLVNEVVPFAELDDCVERWVEDILRCAPLSVRALKEIGLASAHLPLPEAFAARYESEELRRGSEDAREGPLAFIEKRGPNWIGR